MEALVCALFALGMISCGEKEQEHVVVIDSVSITMIEDGYSYADFKDGYMRFRPDSSPGEISLTICFKNKSRYWQSDDWVLEVQPGDTLVFSGEGVELIPVKDFTPVATIIAAFSTQEMGVRSFILDNGYEVRVHCNSHMYTKRIEVFDANGKKLNDSSPEDEVYSRWLRAKKGDELAYHACSDAVIYRIVDQNYSIERVVKKVSKYDGAMSKINGNGRIDGGILSVSGNVNIQGEGMASQNFFINLYFEEGEPVSVCAKDNPLLLDIQPGDTLIEKSIHGFVFYEIK